MRDVFLAMCALMLLTAACSQPIVLLLGLLRGIRAEKRPGFGPYRDSYEGSLQAVLARNADLETRLADAEKLSSKKDRLIEQLWFRAHGVKYPHLRLKRRNYVRRARVAGLATMAAACGMVMGAAMQPSHTAHDYPPHARPTMQAPMTSGGETPVRHPHRADPNRFCLEATYDLHVIRFETYHVYWPSPFRKPDEFDLAFWLTQYHDQQQPVLVATLY